MNDEKSKKGNSEGWFHKDKEPRSDSDLRILLEKMLKECLGMATGNSEIAWNKWTSIIPPRPFVNKFKEKKKSNRVFTDSVTANFIFLCAKRSECGNDKKVSRDCWINKAVDILHRSKFGKAIPSPDNLSILCDSSELFDDCTKAMREGKFSKTDSKCSKCSVCWLYSNLKFVEENYCPIINNSLDILSDFTDDEHRQIVTDIYKSIKLFEQESPEGLCSLDKLIELYNKCNKCFEYPDVADEKIAYIKLFTARLSNWPYFKEKLLEINHYNEEWIYCLLSSASAILRVIETADERLISQVESDKLISYLTLGYTKPFSLPYHEQPTAISSKCIKTIERVNTSEYKLMLYIELLNFYYQIDPGYIERYSKCISELFDKSNNSAEILLLRVRFELYILFYNPASGEQRLKTRNAINTAYCFFNETGVIPESLEFMTDMFLQWFLQCYEKNAADEFLNLNPISVVYNLKGRSSFNDITFSLPQNPGRFQRIFGDYTMSQYYYDRYYSIISHFELNKDNNETALPY